MARIALVLRMEPFEPLRSLLGWHEGPDLDPGQLGAAECHFIGRVRHRTVSGAAIEALDLEHYPGMTEEQIEAMAARCAKKHGAVAVLVEHRVGRLAPGEAIVLVAVMADHRGSAQRCCQELLEELKHEAPFWKREWCGGVGFWVEGNTPLGRSEDAAPQQLSPEFGSHGEAASLRGNLQQQISPRQGADP